MTGIRQSFVFGLESQTKNGFGKGLDPLNGVWYAPPPGSFLSTTQNRATSRITSTGKKNMDDVSYGGLTGSFEWTFTLDYMYLEPLCLAFEGHVSAQSKDSKGTVKPGVYTHTFSKMNNARVPSFTIRRKILNAIAGGGEHTDEMVDLMGCVVRNIRFSRSAGNSIWQVAMSGFYVDEKMVVGDLDATDVKEYSGKLAEYSCLFIGDKMDANTYVANTDSISISIENNSGAIGQICTPISGAYSEGMTNYSFGTSCYSNDPSKYKRRLYSGGVDNTALTPRRKNMRPVPRMIISTCDKSIGDGDATSVEDAFNKAQNSVTFEITNCVIKSLTWQKGDGSKLQDQISGSECKSIVLRVENNMEDVLSEMRNVVSSAGIMPKVFPPAQYTFSVPGISASEGVTIPTAMVQKGVMPPIVKWIQLDANKSQTLAIHNYCVINATDAATTPSAVNLEDVLSPSAGLREISGITVANKAADGKYSVEFTGVPADVEKNKSGYYFIVHIPDGSTVADAQMGRLRLDVVG